MNDSVANPLLDLNIDLGSISTERPCLPKGTYPMTVDEIEVMPNKAGTGQNMLVWFKTTQPEVSNAASANGSDTPDISAGFRVRKYYPLQPSQNPNASDFRKDIAVLHDACHGTTDATRGDAVLNPATFTNCDVLVSVKIEEDEDFGAQNSVTFVAYPA